MRKECFNMYLTKEKSNTNLYKNYKPKISKHQDAEIQVYVADMASKDISKRMKATISLMASEVAHGFI